MPDKLPDKIKRIDVLRVERGLMKGCHCHTMNLTLDQDTRLVFCDDCGAIVEPFDALYRMARSWERAADQIEALLKQRQELLNWKPHLVALREVERTYRGGSMIPYCPHCGRGILAEELARGSTNKERELQRRQFEKKRDA